MIRCRKFFELACPSEDNLFTNLNSRKWVGEQVQEIVPIAFDMEWPFSFQNGPGKSAVNFIGSCSVYQLILLITFTQVIQLCADINVCFVFHISQLTKLPAALVQLLEHPKVRLHGVNIKK